jgi:hypothetical protein
MGLSAHLLEGARLNLAVQDVIDTSADLAAPDGVDLRLRCVIIRVRAGQKAMGHDGALVEVELEPRLVDLVSLWVPYIERTAAC